MDLSSLTRGVDYNSKLELRNDKDPDHAVFAVNYENPACLSKAEFFNSLFQHDGFVS